MSNRNIGIISAINCVQHISITGELMCSRSRDTNVWHLEPKCHIKCIEYTAFKLFLHVMYLPIRPHNLVPFLPALRVSNMSHPISHLSPLSRLRITQAASQRPNSDHLSSQDSSQWLTSSLMTSFVLVPPFFTVACVVEDLRLHRIFFLYVTGAS